MSSRVRPIEKFAAAVAQCGPEVEIHATRYISEYTEL